MVTLRDPLSQTFSALADPVRRAILSRLRQSEATVAELGRPFSISPPAISRHLKVLEQAGLIRRTRDRQWHRVRVSAGPLKDASDWIHDYRLFWEDRFDALARHLGASAGAGQEKNDDDDAR